MPKRLNPDQALLVVIDIQERLVPHIHEHERMIARARVMIAAARILGIPIFLSEQYKKGLGETVPPIREALGAEVTAYEKKSFGCFGDDGQRAAIEATGRRQLILIGIETHVCVLQTALAAIGAGYDVFLAEDALSSRRPNDVATALRRMEQAGAIPATVEMLIMEALGIAAGDQFKAVLPLLK